VPGLHERVNNLLFFKLEPTMIRRSVTKAEQTKSRKMAGVSAVPCISPTITKRTSGRDHNRAVPVIAGPRGYCAP
jgi:hypothetical protein